MFGFKRFLKFLNNLGNFQFLIIVLILNAILVFAVYSSAFLLDFEGDSWQYAWGHKVYYHSTLFSDLAVKAMRTSLGGGHLTFALIENNFGLSPILYYSIAVFLKFVCVLVFYFFVKRLTSNRLSALIASILLAVSFVGVEATHWVFNMYAQIGLIFIIVSSWLMLDLPNEFKFRRWLISFLLACLGVWWATMRTNGIIPLIIVWSFYKYMSLKTKDSKLNLFFWVIGFSLFILIDKFLLGQMESEYSRYYIINQGLNAFQSQIVTSKYDFMLSPATNFGAAMLPDITWASFNFPKLFSFFGPSLLRSVIVPSFIMFAFFVWFLSGLFSKFKNRFGIDQNFLFIFQLGLLWTLIVYLISKIGLQNFTSWENLVMTLFGGYILAIAIYLVIIKEVSENLKNLFLITFFWSFIFLLLPLFQNGGPLFGTYHRYMVATAVAFPLFLAGLITLSIKFKSLLLQLLIIGITTLVFLNHTFATKTFFDHKAKVHNRQLTAQIWGQFAKIVPNKPEFAKETPPTLYFEAADNPIDQQTLFETLYFGFLFNSGLKYDWDPYSGTGLYNSGNYKDLIRDINKNPKLLDNFYAVKIENQSLIDITTQIKQKIARNKNVASN